jgi:ABC-type uncharacterized transport system YnjBCD permease subunit
VGVLGRVGAARRVISAWGGLSALGGFTLGWAWFAVFAGASGSRSAKPPVR